MSKTRRVLLVGALAIPSAELGHVVAYGFRVPSTGAHQYLPAEVHLAGALLAAGLLAALAVITLARLLAGSPARSRPWSFALLFCGLLAAQASMFLVQEGLESGSLPGLTTIAAALLGQQPVALLGALGLRWLSARLGPALEALAAPRESGLCGLDTQRVASAPPLAAAVRVCVRPARARRPRAPPR